MIADWILFWGVVGTTWAWYALTDYFYRDARGMTTGWQVLNIFLNVVLCPIGICFGFFLFFVGYKTEEEGLERIDFEVSVVKLLRYYEKEDDKAE